MNLRRPAIPECTLLACLAFSVLFFGGVYPWVFLPVCAAVFLLTFLYPEPVLKSALPFYLKPGLLCLFAWIALQAKWLSLNLYVTQIEGIKWAAYCAAFFLVWALPPASVRRIAAAFPLLALCEVFYGTLQIATGSEKVLWQVKEAHLGYLTGTYFNRNHLAGFLELSLGPAAGLCIDAALRKKKMQAAGWAVCVFVLMCGLFATASRMGIMAFAVSAAIFTPLMLQRMHRSRRFWILLSAVILLAAAIAGPVLKERFHSLMENAANWDGGRMIVWKSMLPMIRDYVWSGTGLGTFEWVFPAYQPDKLTMGWAHAHNDYLELLVVLGLPAFLLFAALIFSLVRFLVSKMKSSAHAPAAAFGALMSLLALSIHGGFDFNFAIPANAFAFSLLAGCALRLMEGESA